MMETIFCYGCYRKETNERDYPEITNFLGQALQDFDPLLPESEVRFGSRTGAAHGLEEFIDDQCIPETTMDFDGHVVFIEAPARWMPLGPVSIARQVRERLKNAIPVILIHNQYASSLHRYDVDGPNPDGPQKLKEECEMHQIDTICYNEVAERDGLMYMNFSGYVERVMAQVGMYENL